MATVLEIVRGLSQAAANAYDGAMDQDGKAIEVGLMREKGNPLIDKRVMDGFNVRFQGPDIIISYMSDVQLKEVYRAGFETEMDRRIADIAKFLKKEYKNVTGESVSLKKKGEIDVRVESSSRVRSWVTAACRYEVGGMKDVVVMEAGDNELDKQYRDFLAQGGFKGKRPQNDTRKKESKK